MNIRNRRLRRAAAGGLASAIGLVALVVPVGQASAASPTISVSPASGAAGTGVLVSGTNWPGYDNVAVDLKQGSSATFMCEVSASASGSIPSQGCTVPTSLPQGAYSLSATDNTLTAATAFTLNPGITVLGFTNSALISAAAGQTVGLDGSGFTAGSAVKATFNGTSAPLTVPATTSASGQFSGTGITIPSSTAAGTYAVAVKDAAGHTATDHIDVYAASLTVAPTTGVSGQAFTVNGTGWPVNDSLRVLLDQGTSQNNVCFPVTDANGVLAASCTVPTNLPEGSYSLVVEDNSLAVTTPFTLSPGITVLGFTGSPAVSVAAGQTVGLSGSGFAANSTVKATFNGTSAPLTVAATTSSAGQFSGTGIVIPSGTAAGSFPVAVKDSAGHTGTLHVTVYAATLTVTPTSGVSGRLFTVRGTGWPANDSTRVLLDQGTSENNVCFPVTDGNGVLTASCAVPTNLTQGSYSLVVEDNSLAVTKAFTLNPGLTVLGFTGNSALDAAPGQTVGLTGSGFTANSSVKATFNAKSVALTAAATTNGSGQFSGTGIVIPSGTVAGTYPVAVKDASGHTGTVQLRVYAATISVAATGTSGQTFSISGSGFPSNDAFRILLDQGSTENNVCFPTTDGNGNFAVSCTVPTGLPLGSYTMVVEDNSLAVSKAFTIKPGITLINPSNGQGLTTAAPGAAANFSGSGFAPNASIVKLTIGTHTVVLTTAPVANSAGAFSGGAFTVPSIAAGVYTVTVTDSSGDTGTTQLTIS